MTEAVVGKTRIGWIDVLRGFGVVLMIVGHVDFGTPFDRYVHAFHMPLFFVVSGFFFNPRKSYREYLAHDFGRISFPIRFFS